MMLHGQVLRAVVFIGAFYLQSQFELGFKAAAIAADLKREPSTVSRELRRNGWRRSARSRGRRRGIYPRAGSGRSAEETQHHL